MIHITEKCLCCSGTGALGNPINSQLFDCPWCNGGGIVLPEMNATFERVDKVLPEICKAYKVFGDKRVVNKPKPRVA